MSFLFNRGRAASNRKIIDRLNDDIIAAVRNPVFYQSGDVPDTFNGRFELLVLHLALVVRRLRVLQDPAPAMGQDLIDTVFRHLDPAMRELGVGDMAVPKRMKKLAEAFLGRSVAYDLALRTTDGSLADALSRNVYGGLRTADAMSRYVRASAAALDALDSTAFLNHGVAFPDPVPFFVPSGA
ncbi:ubiquinol-cytochrome C chaperone family protein [Lichenihabitans psoromatis]|uniref:ubiquinol-cytochrome C chaperone family protein n=1 Tax=Lichenihabitans psoromatis TaxID=2528642 RepID=UPI001FDFF52F|nr:ubiquinol-cytochrome C chaperone family protein [Lichenihabitans psoromatis]